MGTKPLPITKFHENKKVSGLLFTISVILGIIVIRYERWQIFPGEL
jgi:hypothetical protein